MVFEHCQMESRHIAVSQQGEGAAAESFPIDEIRQISGTVSAPGAQDQIDGFVPDQRIEGI